MELESVKRTLENEEYNPVVDSLPLRFLEPLILQGLRIDLIQPGRLLCSFIVPPRLLNCYNTLHGGAMATIVDIVGSAVVYTVGSQSNGVSVEINVSYMNAAYVGEEVEIEAKTLRVGMKVAVVSVELRKKKTGKIIAQGRHTKYLLFQSKM